MLVSPSEKKDVTKIKEEGKLAAPQKLSVMFLIP